MRLFVGLDVSLAKTAICMISEHGKIVKEAQLESEPEELIRWIVDEDGTIAAIGLAAGPLSQWLHRGLTEAGLDVVLMETRQVKGALKAMPIKTDRRDAEGIARLLHLGWFRPVHGKSVSAQEVRAVLCARKAVQQGFIALAMSLRGLLRNFGLKVGMISRGKFEQRIRELAAGNPMLLAATEPMLRARASLRQELAGLERRVRHLAQDDPVCRRLMTMPGIGVVVALTCRSAVDDPARFTSSKKVGLWVGMTPSRNQSGERDISGGITKAGDVNLRRALCQAATVTLVEGNVAKILLDESKQSKIGRNFIYGRKAPLAQMFSGPSRGTRWEDFLPVLGSELDRSGMGARAFLEELQAERGKPPGQRRVYLGPSWAQN